MSSIRPSELKEHVPAERVTVYDLPVRPQIEPYPSQAGGPGGDERDSLRSALRAVRRSWWIILICAVVAAGAGVAVIETQSPGYQATTYLLLVNKGYQQAIAGGYNPINTLEQQATIADLLTPSLLAQAAMTAGVPPAASYTVTAAGGSANSDVIRIVASTGNARTAAALADATTDDLVTFVRRSDAKQLREARAVLGTQIAGARNITDRRALLGELYNLATLQALSDQSVQVIQRASVPTAPSSPRKARSVAIALVLGVLFGLAVSLLRRKDPGTPA